MNPRNRIPYLHIQHLYSIRPIWEMIRERFGKRREPDPNEYIYETDWFEGERTYEKRRTRG